MSKVAISVIIPVYNVELWLRDCLDSVERQSFSDYEVIIVNDGSTDSSPVIAQKYVAKHDNYKLVNRENGGLSAARNTGLDHASGDWIYFLDSDDYLTDNALEKMYTIATQNEVDVLKFSAYSFTDGMEDFDANKIKYSDKYNNPYTGIELLRDIVQNRNEYLPMTWLLFIKKQLLMDTKIRFYEGIIHEDDLFQFELLFNTPKAMIVNEPLYYRRVRPGSITTNVNLIKKYKSIMISVVEVDKLLSSISANEEDPLTIYLRRYIDTANPAFYTAKLNKSQDAEIKNMLKASKKVIKKYHYWHSVNLFLFTLSPMLAKKFNDIKSKLR